MTKSGSVDASSLLYLASEQDPLVIRISLTQSLTRTALLVALLAGSPVLLAQTVYIDDELMAPLRTGQGTQYRILNAGLGSGTPLTLLERDEETGYSRVRTSRGQEGWILTRYLSNEPIAADQLEKARAELSSAREAQQEAQAAAESLRTERDELLAERADLRQEVQSLSTELDEIKSISSNALNLDRRNQELQETTQSLRNEVELLTTDNQRLRDKSESNFMLLGAALVALGVLIAVIVPMLKPTRKNDSWA